MIMSLAGLGKDVFIVVVSSIIFATPLTAIQIVGYVLSLFGIQVYKDYKSDPQSFYKLPGRAMKCQADTFAYIFSGCKTFIGGDTYKNIRSTQGSSAGAVDSQNGGEEI